MRAITKRPEIFERSVIRSSVMPSAKYSWPSSSDMLLKGSTAMEGLSGRGKAIASGEAGSVRGAQGAHQTSAATAARLSAKPAAITGRRRRVPVGEAGAAGAAPSSRTWKTWIGSGMFLTDCSPRSWKARSTLPLTWL